MARENQIDKAIANLQQEIDVLQLAIAKLKEQRDRKAQRKLRPVKAAKPIEAKEA